MIRGMKRQGDITSFKKGSTMKTDNKYCWGDGETGSLNTVGKHVHECVHRKLCEVSSKKKKT